MNANISSNFYPINSAITLMSDDDKRILTVANDRSQAGSSLEDGSVEFIMNRRIPSSDRKGNDEWLVEVGDWGKGEAVRAKYHLYLD